MDDLDRLDEMDKTKTLPLMTLIELIFTDPNQC